MQGVHKGKHCRAMSFSQQDDNSVARNTPVLPQAVNLLVRLGLQPNKQVCVN